MPVERLAARALVVGDVVRLDEPRAYRVERKLIFDGHVVLELRPVGLAVAGRVRVTAPAETIVDRLGSAGV